MAAEWVKWGGGERETERMTYLFKNTGFRLAVWGCESV